MVEEEHPLPPAALVLAWFSALNCRAPLVATGPLLPLIIPALHLSPQVAGLGTALPLLAMAVLSLPGGWLGDRLGPKAVLVGGLFAIAVGGAARALVRDVATFLAATGFLGAAIGATQPSLTQLARQGGSHRAASVTSIYASGLLIGALAAALISVPLLHLMPRLSWRGVVLTWAAVGLATAAAWFFVPLGERRRAGKGRQNALLPARMPGMAQLSAIFALQSATFYALTAWLPEYYVARGSALFAASLPLTAVMAASVPAGLLAPWLLRTFRGFRRPLLLTGLASALAMIGFLVVPGMGILWGAVAGFSTSSAFTLCMAAPAMRATPETTGRMAGVLLTIGYAGAVVGPLVVGVLRGAFGTFAASFDVLAAIGAVWGLVGALVPERARESGAPKSWRRRRMCRSDARRTGGLRACFRRNLRTTAREQGPCQIEVGPAFGRYRRIAGFGSV